MKRFHVSLLVITAIFMAVTPTFLKTTAFTSSLPG